MDHSLVYVISDAKPTHLVRVHTPAASRETDTAVWQLHSYGIDLSDTDKYETSTSAGGRAASNASRLRNVAACPCPEGHPQRIISSIGVRRLEGGGCSAEMGGTFTRIVRAVPTCFPNWEARHGPDNGEWISHGTTAAYGERTGGE